MKIAICCTDREYDSMREFSRLSDCRNFSEYARAVLLKKPVAITHRNLSLDSLIDALNAVNNGLERLLDHQSLRPPDLAQITALLQEIKIICYKIADECILK
jgi:hypothetical protein